MSLFDFSNLKYLFKFQFGGTHYYISGNQAANIQIGSQETNNENISSETQSYMTQWKWYVYIIECFDGSFYTGMTWNPSNRFEQHLSKLGGKYTKKHGVKKLAYLEEYDNLEEARLREKQIHGWNRDKKLKLIKGEWKKL